MTIFKEIQQKVLEITNVTSDIYDIPRLMDTLIEQVFLRSGRFIMEFIQNAEDACMVAVKDRKIKFGILRIELDKDKIVIMHNGKPFDKEDLIAICGLKSRKKPEEGYLGYLGIGFKSVFKVSNKVVIYSRGEEEYCFKFDKEEAERIWGVNIPWQCLPIEIPTSSLEISLPKRFTTMFIIYLKDSSFYEQIKESLEKLRYPVFLFLRYISEIEIRVNSSKRKIKIIPQRNEERNKLKIEEIFVAEDSEDGHEWNEFLVFKKTFDIPEDIKNDDVTRRARRDKVKRREISVAFLVKNDKLSKIEGEMISGFYSFLPLEEARTGLGFLVQADFITQAGREQMVFEAKWNKWMMERVTDVVEEAIEYFQENPNFCESYLPIFEIEESYDDFYIKLVKPILKERINKLLADPKVPTPSGDLILLSKAVVCSSEIRELVEKGIVKEDDLEILFGEKGLRFISEEVKIGEREVKVLRISDLLSNKELIGKKKEKRTAIQFLVEVYKHADKTGKLPTRDAYVLDRWDNIVLANECYFSRLPEGAKDLLEKYPEIEDTLVKYRLIHPSLEEIREILENVGVKYITYREICERVLLPKISAENKDKVSKNDALIISTLLKKGNILPYKSIWVLTKDGDIRESEKVFLFDKDLVDKLFKDIKKFDNIILDIGSYLELDGDEVGWKEFFENAGVKLIEGYWDEFISDYISNYITYVIEQSKNTQLLVKFTWIAKEVWKIKRGFLSAKIPILTKDGRVVDPEECYLSSAYGPQENWERWLNLFNIGPFVSGEYLKIDNDAKGWKSFLINMGIKDSIDKSEVIGEFAESFAKHILEKNGFKIIGGKGDGYDFIAEKGGETLYIQVKGRKKIQDIELKGKEVEKAIEKRESYCVLVVYNIPNKPTAHLLKNPADKGEQALEIFLKSDVITQQGQKISSNSI